MKNKNCIIFIKTNMNKIKINEFNVSNVTFQMKIDQKSKRKVFFVNHNEQPILIQTPKMYYWNGIKHWKSDAYPESFELELSFSEDKENEVNNRNIQDMKEKMTALDNLIKQKIHDDPKTWVGKPKASMEMIETAFYPNPIIRVAKDKDGNVLEYAPKMRIKLERERNGDEFSGFFRSTRQDRILIYDNNGANLNLNEENCESVVPRGTKGISIIQLVNINVVGDKVYPKWRLVQAKVFRNQNSITSNIIDDDVDDVDDDVEVDVDKVEDLDSETPVQETVEDDVVEQDQEEEFVPVKSSKGKKKGVGAHV